MFLHILKTLAWYARFYKANLLIVAISLISVSFSLLTIGSIFKDLVDNGLKANNLASINNSVLLICFTIFIFGISSFFRSYFINLVAEKIITDIKTKIYNHLMKCEVANFEDMKIGDLISRLGYDTEQLAKLIINFFSFFLRNSVMLIGSVALMFAQSPKLSIIVLISIPILLFPLLKLSKFVRKLSRFTADFQGTLAANIDESFSNIHVIHAYNLQQDRIDNFAKQTKEFLVSSKTRLRSRSLFFASAISAILFSIALVLWIGSRDIINGDISSGQVISFIYFALIAGTSGGGIAELLSEMQLPLASANRIFSLLELPIPKNQANDDLPHISPLIIEFDNVSFTYPTRNNKALKNISFELKSRFTGIVGASGSGKSTIMQLLMKFYQPNSGIIKINNRDINNINTDSIRDLVSYVPQDPKIFSGSIFSNIALANPNASAEEVQKIALVTGIKFFADKLKDGIYTEIGEKGVKLSGGQKQRIALARALLRNTEILLLDEATSSLDINDETQLFENISDFIKNKKIIWIAHRMSSLQSAEQILVINDGKLLFQGNNKEFANQKQLHQALSIE